MKDHYSTVGEDEQREALERVLARVKPEALELTRTSVTSDALVKA